MIITNHDFYQSIDKIQPSKCTERLHHGKVQSSLLETTLTITSIGIVSPEDINTCSLPQQLLPHYPFFHSLSLLSVVRLLFCWYSSKVHPAGCHVTHQHVTIVMQTKIYIIHFQPSFVFQLISTTIFHRRSRFIFKIFKNRSSLFEFTYLRFKRAIRNACKGHSYCYHQPFLSHVCVLFQHANLVSTFRCKRSRTYSNETLPLHHHPSQLSGQELQIVKIVHVSLDCRFVVFYWHWIQAWQLLWNMVVLTGVSEIPRILRNEKSKLPPAMISNSPQSLESWLLTRTNFPKVCLLCDKKVKLHALLEQLELKRLSEALFSGHIRIEGRQDSGFDIEQRHPRCQSSVILLYSWVIQEKLDKIKTLTHTVCCFPFFIAHDLSTHTVPLFRPRYLL